MENGTKQVSRSWLPILADMFSTDVEERTIVWISDKVEALVVGEPMGESINGYSHEKKQLNQQ